MRAPSVTTQQRADGRAVNWGRQIPESSTLVEAELVSLSLPYAQDITITTLPKQQHAQANFWPLQVTAGAGGTSAQFEVFPSVRGSVFHVCAAEVVVRVARSAFPMLDGDGLETSAPPAAIGCYAALGRPVVTQQKRFTLSAPAQPTRDFEQTINPAFPSAPPRPTPGPYLLGAYATRARLVVRKKGGYPLSASPVYDPTQLRIAETGVMGNVYHTLADLIEGIDLHPMSEAIQLVPSSDGLTQDLQIELIETFER